MSKSKIAKNVTSSLILQVCSVVCGFVIPKLILNSYGSEVNGLVNSISQFLSFISLLDLGVGAVVQAALYKPLAEKNQYQIDCIVTAAEKFFRIIGTSLLVYVLILVVTYPFFAKQNFGFVYTATLILSISVSTFAQYYFGVVDRLFLTADQKGFIQYDAQIVTLILNTVSCAVLIRAGCGIHAVKITTSLIYLARPLFLRCYVNKHYRINRRQQYEGEPIPQKWNGIAQHVSSVVLNNTDTIVLTILASLSDVSIYSIYNLVVSGLKQLFEVSTSGVEAALGELWAKRELNRASTLFLHAEWVLHTAVTYVFANTAVLIVPFVLVYTKGVDDAQYAQPLFAVLIVLAHMMHCYRLPYHITIKATGHFKQTQKCYLVSTALNLILSIVTVKVFGLIGVAIGTLIAMAYQTIWMAKYCEMSLIKVPISHFLKRMLINVVLFFTSYILAQYFVSLTEISILQWIYAAIKSAVITLIVFIVVNALAYRHETLSFLRKVIHRG